MQPSLIKLRKIFALEAKREYDDGAVVGGIEKMLFGWAAEARAEDVNEPLILAVTSQLRNYEDLEPEYRAVAINNVWSRIETEVGIEDPEKPDLKAKTQSFQIKERPVSKRPASADGSKPAPTKKKRK